MVERCGVLSLGPVTLAGERTGFERIYYYQGNYHVLTGIGTNGYMDCLYVWYKNKDEEDLDLNYWDKKYEQPTD